MWRARGEGGAVRPRRQPATCPRRRQACARLGGQNISLPFWLSMPELQAPASHTHVTLQDAIAINDSSYAVAWTLEGNVWVSVVSEVPDRLSQPPWVRQFSATVPVLASVGKRRVGARLRELSYRRVLRVARPEKSGAQGRFLRLSRAEAGVWCSDPDGTSRPTPVGSRKCAFSNPRDTPRRGGGGGGDQIEHSSF